MLPGLPFFQPAMICCDPVDVRTILASGPRALGWLHTDLTITIDEWDILSTLLTERLPPNADLLLTPFPNPKRGHGERLLSLTVVGD
jgi:hypothetical protein